MEQLLLMKFFDPTLRLETVVKYIIKSQNFSKSMKKLNFDLEGRE